MHRVGKCSVPHINYAASTLLATLKMLYKSVLAARQRKLVSRPGRYQPPARCKGAVSH